MRLAFAFAAALIWAAQPAAAQDTVTLKLSHFLGPRSFFELDFAQPWARELEARTNGKVRVEIFNGASPLGQVTRQASQVKDGTIDIALGLRGAEGDRFPRSAIIELPFMVRDALHGSRAIWTVWKDGMLGDEFADYKVLALFVHNPGLIHTASKRVVTVGDMNGLRLRAPNQAVAAALTQIGAHPVILQVNDVMPAVTSGQLDGIVTNWGNPLPGFNDLMKFHTQVPFYSSLFFVVMNKAKFASLPPDAQAAVDALSNEALVDRFGMLWNKWDQPVFEGAHAPGHEIITPDEQAMQAWHEALKQSTRQYIAQLVAGGFVQAQAVYDRLAGPLPEGAAARSPSP
jgi:TRAP-type C4-dicarboxylate transport system substrate-binding protein